MNEQDFIKFGLKQVQYFSTEKAKHHWKSPAGEELEGKEYDYRKLVENFIKAIENPEIQSKLKQTKLLENISEISSLYHFDLVHNLFLSLIESEASGGEHFEANKAEYYRIWGQKPPPITQAELDKINYERLAKIESEKAEALRLQDLEAKTPIVYAEKLIDATISIDKFAENILPYLSVYGVPNQRNRIGRKFDSRSEMWHEWIGEAVEGLEVGTANNKTKSYLDIRIIHTDNPYSNYEEQDKLEGFNLIHKETGKKLFIFVRTKFVDYGEREIEIRFEGEKEIVEKLKEELNRAITKY